jgi:hypothetical protein
MNNREVLGDGCHLVARIVSSYVKHNRVAADELQTMIASVHQSLRSLGKAPTSTEPLMPAVPIRRSVQPEYVICLSQPDAPATSARRARPRACGVLCPPEAAGHLRHFRRLRWISGRDMCNEDGARDWGRAADGMRSFGKF